MATDDVNAFSFFQMTGFGRLQAIERSSPVDFIPVLIEKRHFDALSGALAEVKEAEMLCGKVPLDLLGVHLKAAWDRLGEISGKTAAEEIINEIFAKFCVGK